MRTFILIVLLLSCSSVFAQSSPAALAIKQIEVGFNRICTLFETGEIACAGKEGQFEKPMHLIKLPQDKRAVKLALGNNHICAILDDGSIACWADFKVYFGDTTGGMAPDPSKPRIIKVNGLRATSIEAKAAQTCAIFENGSATCWGFMDDKVLKPLPLLELPPGIKAKKIAPGVNHTCAILSDDKVYCWGANRYRNLGTPPESDEQKFIKFRAKPTVPVNFGPGTKAIAVTASADFTCVILSLNASPQKTIVKCFGRNDSASLGAGNIAPTDSKTEIKDLEPVRLPQGFFPNRIFSAMERVCALNPYGILICWGSNTGFSSSVEDEGVIGDLPSELGDAMVPFNWGTLIRARSAAIGPYQTCITSGKTSAYCWGRGRFTPLENYVNDFSQNPIEKFPEIKPINFAPAFEKAKTQ